MIARRDRADDDADRRVRAERGDGRLRRRAGIANTGAVPSNVARTPVGHRRRERDGDERARTVLEQQQLDGEQHGAHRTAERRRHAGRGAGGEQDLPLVARDAEELPAQRAERAAGRDDRPLGAERSAGADGDRRGERLEEEHARRDAALAEQHALHHLGDAVAANRRRAVARHQPDDQRAGDRDEQQDERRSGPPAGETRCRDEMSVVGEARDGADQSREQLCGEGRRHGDADRQAGEHDRAVVDGLVVARCADGRLRPDGSLCVVAHAPRRCRASGA